MFSLTQQTGPGVSRRELLKIGGLALGGLTLPGLLARQAAAAQNPLGLSGKSVVLLFLQGGPPQVETFDPKAGAPSDYRSMTGETQTALPGITFGGTLPKIAARADRLAVVRNFGAGKGGLSHEAGYDRILRGGDNEFEAPMGALFARAGRSLNPKTGVPTNAILLPEAIDPEIKLGNPSGAFTYQQTRRYFAHSGTLGSEYTPFDPSGGGPLLENMDLNLPRGRFEDRRLLLEQLDGIRRRIDSDPAVQASDAVRLQAYEVLARGISQAFDLSQEDPRTLAAYDTSHFVPLKRIRRGGSQYWNNFNRTTNLLGKQMLLARRLCEAGCGLVTVVDSCWDFHDDGNNPPVDVGMNVLSPQLDHAVTAFLEDLEARGLSDDILLIVTAEMGRTPRKGSRGGTGHWGDLTPLLLAGGGLKMGQVIGASDRLGAYPAEEPYGPENLLATVFHTLFDVGEVRLRGDLPTALLNLITTGRPIGELHG